jgi:RNA polymerase sigma-70 factor (ECF subfamily)
LEDAQIIELYFKRDEQAILESDRTYGAYCYTVSYQILNVHEDAQECVNDTWMRAWNAIPPTRPARLKQFFSKITRHLSFDKYRKDKAVKRGGGQMPIVLDELEECIGGTPLEQEAEAKELAQSIRLFLHTLSERDRNLFLCRYFYAKPLGEIAESFGIRENHAAVILSRTRSRLKEHLQKEGYVL